MNEKSFCFICNAQIEKAIPYKPSDLTNTNTNTNINTNININNDMQDK